METTEVMEKSELDQLEESYQEALDDLRELDQQAWMEIKQLNHKGGKVDNSFDIERYRALKKKRQNQLPLIESRLRKARISSYQARRADAERELKSLEPELLRRKAIVERAMEVLEEAGREFALVEFRMAILEQELRANDEDVRHEQRQLTSLIQDLTGVKQGMGHDGLSAKTENLLIR